MGNSFPIQIQVLSNAPKEVQCEKELLQPNHRRIFQFTLKIPSRFAFTQRVPTHGRSERGDFRARYVEHKRMPPNVKSQAILQDPAISLLTLFGTIKPAQLGPPILTPSQEEGCALGRKQTRGPDYRLLRGAPSGGMQSAVMEGDLAENVELSRALTPGNTGQRSFLYTTLTPNVYFLKFFLSN